MEKTPKTPKTRVKNKWIKCGLPYGPIYNDDYTKKDRQLDSFTKMGLGVPGTVIKLRQLKSRSKNKSFYGKEEIYLIGDINPIRGVCDDCVAFDKDTIIDEYKILEM